MVELIICANDMSKDLVLKILHFSPVISVLHASMV